MATRSSNRPRKLSSPQKKKEICSYQPPPNPFLSPWSISGGGRGGDWVCERVSDHSRLSSPDRERHCMSGLTQIRTTHCKVSALHTAPQVWLLFITQDNINSRLNKLGGEASFEAFHRFLTLFFLNFNPQRASRHPLSSFTLPLHLCLCESVSIT